MGTASEERAAQPLKKKARVDQESPFSLGTSRSIFETFANVGTPSGIYICFLKNN